MIPTGSLRTRFYAGTFSEGDIEGRVRPRRQDLDGRFLENQVIAEVKDGQLTHCDSEGRKLYHCVASQTVLKIGSVAVPFGTVDSVIRLEQ